MNSQATRMTKPMRLCDYYFSKLRLGHSIIICWEWPHREANSYNGSISEYVSPFKMEG